MKSTNSYTKMSKVKSNKKPTEETVGIGFSGIANGSTNILKN